VVSGYGIIEIGDERVEVQDGSLVMVPPGIDHNVIGNDRDEHLAVLCIFAVAPGHEEDPTPWKPVGSD
jgi:mannose-6-phosphate isomerase-like protein (cupin superfamily)